jgi:hypothetical protein
MRTKCFVNSSADFANHQGTGVPYQDGSTQGKSYIMKCDDIFYFHGNLLGLGKGLLPALQVQQITFIPRVGKPQERSKYRIILRQKKKKKKKNPRVTFLVATLK